MVTQIRAVVRKRTRLVTLLAVIVLLLMVAVSTTWGADEVEVRVEYNIVINRPVEEVWAFTSNPDNAALWIEGVRESKLNPPGKMEVGATGRQVVEMGFGMESEADYEVTAYVPNETLSYQVTSGLLAGFGVIEAIAPTAGLSEASLLTWSLQGTLDGSSRLLKPIYTEMFQSRLERDFATLKALLESR